MPQPIIFIAGKPVTLRGTGFLGRRRGARLELGGHRAYVRAHLRAAQALGYEPHVFVVGKRSSVEATDLATVHTVRSVPLPGRQTFIPFHAPFLERAVYDLGTSLAAGPALIHGFGIWGVIGVRAARRLRAGGVIATSINSFYTTYAHQARGKSVGWVTGHGPLHRVGNAVESTWISAAVRRLERQAYREATMAVTNYDSVDRLLIEVHGRRPLRRMPYASESSFGDGHDSGPCPRASPGSPRPTRRASCHCLATTRERVCRC